MSLVRYKTEPDKKRQILFSAGRVFSKKGFHEASITDVIKHAGIARGTFYLYFKSKRDVFDSLLNELLVELDERIRPVDLSLNSEPLQQVKDNIRRVIELITREPDLAKILFLQSTGLDKRSSEAVQEFYERILTMIEGALKLGIQIGLVRKCNTRITAIIALGTVKEVANSLISSKKQMPSMAIIVDEIIHYGLSGIFTNPWFFFNKICLGYFYWLLLHNIYELTRQSNFYDFEIIFELLLFYSFL